MHTFFLSKYLCEDLVTGNFLHSEIDDKMRQKE